MPGQMVTSCRDWNTEEFFRSASLDTVMTCLASGAGIAERADDGHTPLHHAAWYSESAAVVEALLAAVLTWRQGRVSTVIRPCTKPPETRILQS